MKTYIAIGLLFLFLFACTETTPTEVTLTPFAGGTEGVVISFDNFPKSVFDQGKNQFDVFVKLENRGEKEIPKEDVRVKLTGFEQFDTQGVSQKNPDENLVGVKKDPQGNVVPGIPQQLDFTANYLSPVHTIAEFSVQASACYKYETNAVSKMCVRQDLQNPAAGGLCIVDETKPSYSSGAPVQISKIVEQASGSSKIQFSFDVTHTGGGIIYRLGHDCSSLRALQNKVMLKVDTGKVGSTCTQLKTQEGTAVSGEIDLTGGARTIYCSIPIEKKSDYEFPISMNAQYTYEITTPVQQLTVKEST